MGFFFSILVIGPLIAEPWLNFSLVLPGQRLGLVTPPSLLLRSVVESFEELGTNEYALVISGAFLQVKI